MSLTAEKTDNKAAHLEHADKISTKSSNSVFDIENLDELDSIESTPASKFVWLVSITASVGGLLFGKVRRNFATADVEN